MDALHTIEITNDLMTVLDEDDHGLDCHPLISLHDAEEQLRRWQEEYHFDYADALSAVSDFFNSMN